MLDNFDVQSFFKKSLIFSLFIHSPILIKSFIDSNDFSSVHLTSVEQNYITYDISKKIRTLTHSESKILKNSKHSSSIFKERYLPLLKQRYDSSFRGALESEFINSVDVYEFRNFLIDYYVDKKRADFEADGKDLIETENLITKMLNVFHTNVQNYKSYISEFNTAEEKIFAIRNILKTLHYHESNSDLFDFFVYPELGVNCEGRSFLSSVLIAEVFGNQQEFEYSFGSVDGVAHVSVKAGWQYLENPDVVLSFDSRSKRTIGLVDVYTFMTTLESENTEDILNSKSVVSDSIFTNGPSDDHLYVFLRYDESLLSKKLNDLTLRNRSDVLYSIIDKAKKIGMKTLDLSRLNLRWDNPLVLPDFEFLDGITFTDFSSLQLYPLSMKGFNRYLSKVGHRLYDADLNLQLLPKTYLIGDYSIENFARLSLNDYHLLSINKTVTSPVVDVFTTKDGSFSGVEGFYHLFKNLEYQVNVHTFFAPYFEEIDFSKFSGSLYLYGNTVYTLKNKDFHIQNLEDNKLLKLLRSNNNCKELREIDGFFLFRCLD